MAQITGEITATLGDKTYQLCLGMIGFAQLQQEYGQQLEPITKLDPEREELPDFGVIVRIVEIALQRHHPEANRYVADDLCRQDMSLVYRLLEAAMPAGAEDAGGKGKAGGAKKTPARR